MWENAETRKGVGDDLLERGLRHLQIGEWQAAHACFAELVRRDPNNRTYRELLDRVQFQAKIRERPPKSRRRRVAHSRRIWMLILVNLIVWTALAGRELYRQQIVPALAQHRELIALETLIQRGQQALAQGDVETAQEAFQEVLRRDPQNPIAKEVLTTIQTQRWLAEQYAQAMALVQGERWAEALEHLRQIEQRSPGYRDVADQIARVQRMQRAAEMFENAEALFRAGSWAQAARQFDQLRRTIPEFKPDVVTARLFAAYMNQARTFLDTFPESLEDEIAVMESALEWLSRARDVHPSDREAQRQYRLAYSYLRALQAYRRASWELAILYLNNVYPEAPDYRDGRVAHRLQAAFVQAGNHYLRLGRTERAAERFRQAIAIGMQGGGRPVPATAQELLARADELARQTRVDEALALYGQILAKMGFESPVPTLTVSESRFELWRQEIACVGPGGVNFCPDLKVKRRPSRTARSPAPSVQTYVVRPGDSLSKIAQQFGTTVQALMEANPIIKNPRLIRPGWQLVIPSSDGSATLR